jgi:hypothetical protein
MMEDVVVKLGEGGDVMTMSSDMKEVEMESQR